MPKDTLILLQKVVQFQKLLKLGDFSDFVDLGTMDKISMEFNGFGAPDYGFFLKKHDFSKIEIALTP